MKIKLILMANICCYGMEIRTTPGPHINKKREAFNIEMSQNAQPSSTIQKKISGSGIVKGTCWTSWALTLLAIIFFSFGSLISCPTPPYNSTTCESWPGPCLSKPTECCPSSPTADQCSRWSNICTSTMPSSCCALLVPPYNPSDCSNWPVACGSKPLDCCPSSPTADQCSRWSSICTIPLPSSCCPQPPYNPTDCSSWPSYCGTKSVDCCPTTPTYAQCNNWSNICTGTIPYSICCPYGGSDPCSLLCAIPCNCYTPSSTFCMQSISWDSCVVCRGTSGPGMITPEWPINLCGPIPAVCSTPYVAMSLNETQEINENRDKINISMYDIERYKIDISKYIKVINKRSINKSIVRMLQQQESLVPKTYSIWAPGIAMNTLVLTSPLVVSLLNQGYKCSIKSISTISIYSLSLTYSLMVFISEVFHINTLVRLSGNMTPNLWAVISSFFAILSNLFLIGRSFFIHRIIKKYTLS